MGIPFFNVLGDTYNSLCCPSCEQPNLHHGKIEIFNRHCEDDTRGEHISVDEGEMTLNKNMKGNPSSRRNGIRIWFDCEHCVNRCALTIAQHKGNTFLNMEIHPKYHDVTQLGGPQ